MDAQTHWEKIYTEKAPDAVSWYRPHLETSLALIEQAATDCSASVIDVGGGESTLVDDLLTRGYENLTVLAPLVLSPEQVKMGLAELEFRDQLLVFLEGALGIRQGELGALRWIDCDFESRSFSVQHSYYWRRGGHLKCTKTEASTKLLPMHPSLKHALLDWKSQSLHSQPEDFVFPSERLRGKKPLDLASVLKKKIQPAFRRIGITGVGWHTFRHTVGTMLAEMGEHQLTIRDYLRHSNLHVTNKYLQATSKTKRSAQDKLVEAILPGGFLRRENLIQ